MPEIIEIKEYTDFIKNYILNKKLLDISILSGRYKRHGPPKLFTELLDSLPSKITTVNSKGKFTYISMSNDLSIGITLGLTGGWFFKKNNTDKLIHGLSETRYSKENVERYVNRAKKHLNIEFIFENGSLFFYDQLNFGSISIFTNKTLLDKKLKSLGYDIMDTETDLAKFKNIIKNPRYSDMIVANFLTEQSKISGIGNYLRSEVLWLSKISPYRKLKNLTDTDIKNLFNNLKKQTWGNYNYDIAIEMNIVNKRDIFPRDYNREFFVYSQKNDIYGNTITVDKLVNNNISRSIYWVEDYQI